MTAPERIWAEDRSTFGRIVAFGTQTVRTPVEYIRADLAAPDPLLAEALEALRGLVDRYDEVVTTPDCSCSQDDHDVQRARAVLAKGEGR